MSQRPSPVRVNGHAVDLQHAHGPATGRALATVSATVELTAEDVTAVLYEWVARGGELAELDDDEQVRLFIAETVVNTGCVRVDEARATTRDDALLRECRRRATEVLGAAPVMT